MFKREKAWINSKLRKGVTKDELRECVGAFSNKKKSKVMKEKNITSEQYEKRKKFLANVYFLL